jgi:hypothetical protein
MRLATSALFVACMGAAAIGSAQAQWTEAKIPNEQQRAAQGCAAEARNPGDWTCILVRCDQPGLPPSLHFSTSGPAIQGSVRLVIGDDSFAISVPASPKSPLPWSTRAQGLGDDLLEAMKAGRSLAIEGTALTAPYNQISLQNSREAIERIEWACSRPYPGAAALWRRITRSVGLP